MSICQVAAVAVCGLVLVATTEVRGHGRVHSSVAADVWEDGVRVTIKAALIDLVVVGGLDFEAIGRLPPEKRSDRLRPHLETLAGRFHLIGGNDRFLVPGSVEIEIPDYTDEAFLAPGLDQQQMAIVLDYPLASPPEELVFWQRFGEGGIPDLYPTGPYHSPYERDHADGGTTVIPIYTSLTIRQKGELVLLPSELGPGFLVAYSLRWDEDPVPLAHRTSLRDAACGWENRPAHLRLSVDDREVVLRVYLAREALAESVPNGTGPALQDYLADRVELSIDGRCVDPGELEVTVYPMSAMAVLHGRTLPPGDDRPGTVIVELASGVTEPPDQVEATWNLFSRTVPRVYAEVLDGGEPGVVSVLTPASRRLRIR